MTGLVIAVVGLVLALPGAEAMAQMELLPGTIAYYAFDDETYNDYSTNGYHGYVYAGTPQFTNDVRTNKNCGLSLDMRGGNNAMGVADGGAFNPDTEEISVSFWMKGPPSGSWSHSISKGLGDNAGWALRSRGEWNLGLTGTGRSNLGVNMGDESKWQHFVLIYQSVNVGPGVQKAYRDGVLVNSKGGSGKITDIAQDFRLGTDGGEYSQQMIDEVHIINRVITTNEIAYLRDFCACPPPAGMVLIVR